MIDDLTPTQRELAGLMSDISENPGHAAWMQELPCELWAALKLPASRMCSSSTLSLRWVR